MAEAKEKAAAEPKKVKKKEEKITHIHGTGDLTSAIDKIYQLNQVLCLSIEDHG